MAESARNKTAPRMNLPDKIGKYDIINEVGTGSTGSVYLSHDPYFGRDVAIKVYDVQSDDDPQRAKIARKMFFNEAHMVGMLQHPNILPIYDAGEENDQYYIVMEHIQGARTLEVYCRPDNLLRIDDVIKIIYKCAKALHYAHKRGVIHRDVKPSNIMLTTENDVRIIDYGIAILKDADISRIEGIAGSPSYMSPEQIKSAEISPSSDLYSLGAVMYELLTGFRPFRASTLTRLLNQIIYATAAPIHTLRADVPEELEDIVTVALQKDPQKRYADGGKFAAKLTRVFQGLREQYRNIDNQEHFDILRRLRFFHDFSQKEIWDLLRASEWREYQHGQALVREGEIDDRFYVIVSGKVNVEASGQIVGSFETGDCFGEAGYVSNAKQASTIMAEQAVTVLSVSSTLLEQVSTECQLRFTKVFLRSLIIRLQGGADAD
ncbi:MAG: cyclic nucleotide-binding domain-containing protein [Gammaproteobacteria bacterium]|nr:MAG: cyclic nucleotide-binding domain-containing protein [Gammaproteobacteria bacterium]